MCHACNERNEGEDRLRTVQEGKVGTIGPKGLYIVHCFSDLLIFFFVQYTWLWSQYYKFLIVYDIISLFKLPTYWSVNIDMKTPGASDFYSLETYLFIISNKCIIQFWVKENKNVFAVWIHNWSLFALTMFDCKQECVIYRDSCL